MPAASKRSSLLQRWDRGYLWHPFTQQAEWTQREPVIIASGKGVWLRDMEGRRFLDGVSSLWVNVFGHRKPELDSAVARQLGKLAHSTFLGLTHEPAILLARCLVRIAPRPPRNRRGSPRSGGPLSRVFYSDNGSTAVEVALKMSYQYWQLQGKAGKTRFVYLKDSYHGDTLGAVSVGGMAVFHERFRRLLFKGYEVEPGDFRQIERLLRRRRHEIAAVILEPLIQGASGMRVAPRGYLAHVARLCRRYRILLIADEVATGFGRTGTMFAVEQEKVRPDFLCLAKSLTGGYLPLAATLTTEKVYSAFLGRYDEFKAFFHGHTYTANPLACAAALANIELYEKENLLERVRARAGQLAEGLAPLRRHPHVREVRQVGLMAGIELVQDKGRGRAYPPSARMGLRVCDACLKRGVWLRPLGDVVVLMPPLSISPTEMQFLVKTIRAAIEEVTGTQRVF